MAHIFFMCSPFTMSLAIDLYIYILTVMIKADRK